MIEKATFTVQEVAQYLGIGRNKAYELVQEKRFPILKIGKQIKVPIKPLERWLEQGN